MSELFPSTARAWIEAQFETGEPGRLEVGRHIMEVYAEPLSIYYRGGWKGRFGDADDVVAGFFADRLDRPDFLVKWLESGLRLRIWLCKALSYHLKERGNRATRDGKVTFPGSLDETVGESDPPSAALERAFARSIVRRALHEAWAECLDKGQFRHWEIFRRHYVEGLRYAEVAAQIDDLTPAQAAVLVRLVVRRFRASLRQQLVRDGVRPERIDIEIEYLLKTGESLGG